MARQHSGTGLGLAVSKSLVELRGGTLKVESEKGRGSRFFFTLPAANDQPLTIETQSGQQAIPAFRGNKISNDSRSNGRLPLRNTHKTKILIIDDEPLNIQIIQNHLQDTDYHIDSCTWNRSPRQNRIRKSIRKSLRSRLTRLNAPSNVRP